MATDTRDYEEYVAARWADLVRAATFFGCTVPEAQDLAQTALLKCFLAWARVSQAQDVDAYVYKVLVNTYRDSRRRHWIRELPLLKASTTGSSVDDRTYEVDVSDAVQRALATLPTGNREVLVLRYLVGLTERQTASALGIPVGTVKSRAARAVLLLSQCEQLSDFSKESTNE